MRVRVGVGVRVRVRIRLGLGLGLGGDLVVMREEVNDESLGVHE